MTPLDAEAIRRALGDCTIGREVVVLEETTSTSDEILSRVRKPAVGQADPPSPKNSGAASSFPPEGLVIFAEHQTAGRGQRANRWESAAHKGLWFSILLRPKIDVADSPRLTRWALSAIADAIREEFGVEGTIKAPNDIQINGRKVAGVLVEMRAQPDGPHIAIVGIGINANQTTEDFSDELQARAVSLSLVLGREVDRHEFAVALLRKLDRAYSQAFP